jgi:hypothetical protein
VVPLVGAEPPGPVLYPVVTAVGGGAVGAAVLPLVGAAFG